MTTPRIESIKMNGPAGILEGILRIPPVAPRRCALLCHPHPLYQGSMHSPVIFRAAKALHRRDYVTLRFNFRGVGMSAGSYSGGTGEKADVQAALEVLAARCPGLPVTLLGYSFGARVGLEAAAQDPRVERLVAIGLPLDAGSSDLLTKIRKPLWVLQGDQDEFGSVRELEKLAEMSGEHLRLLIVPGADHHFTGALDRLEETLYQALGE